MYSFTPIYTKCSSRCNASWAKHVAKGKYHLQTRAKLAAPSQKHSKNKKSWCMRNAIEKKTRWSKTSLLRHFGFQKIRNKNQGVWVQSPLRFYKTSIQSFLRFLRVLNQWFKLIHLSLFHQSLGRRLQPSPKRIATCQRDPRCTLEWTAALKRLKVLKRSACCSAKQWPKSLETRIVYQQKLSHSLLTYNLIKKEHQETGANETFVTPETNFMGSAGTSWPLPCQFFWFLVGTRSYFFI